MNVYCVSIDLAKNVFQVCGITDKQKIVFNRQLKRSEVLDFFKTIQCQYVAMEACGGANYWGRELAKLGFQVRLIPTHKVRPFMNRNKNDRNDAMAIAEASLRPGLQTVQAKSLNQQDAQVLLRAKEHFTDSYVALGNMIRGLLAEYGEVIPKGETKLRSTVPQILEDAENGLTGSCRELIRGLFEDYLALILRVKEFNQQIKLAASQEKRCERLQTIPGIGPMIALSIFAQMSNPLSYKNGRQYSASLGLVPRQFGSGGRVKLLGIGGRGNTKLRSLLIHGARSVVTKTVSGSQTSQNWEWIRKKVDERGFNRAVVALANKNARMAWALMAAT